MNQNKTLRFAVGGPKEYRSAIWRIWAKKDSVYLTTLHLGGTIKLSLHPKVWLLAYTQESGIKVPGSTGRVEKRWEPSPQFKNGWIHGPSLIIPATHIKKVFNHILHKDLSKVLWINLPKAGYKYQFTILFAEPKVLEDDLQNLLGRNDVCLGSFYLSNNKKVFLCQKELEITKMEESILAFYKNNTINFTIMPKQVFASIIESHVTSSGHPYLVDIPLGWEDIRINNASK